VARKKARQRRKPPQVSVVCFRHLLEGDEGGDNGQGRAVHPPAEEPVQLAMFAM
jgi:hypothetical protein